MKTWTKARLLVGAAIALSLPGMAQSQIFYNEKLDAQAKAAMTEYQAMRDAHLAMLKERQAAVAALSERVDKAVTAGVQAERDREVVRVLSRPLRRAGEIPSRREELEELIDQRIEEISGLTVRELRDPNEFQRQLLDKAGIATTGVHEEAYRPSLMFDEANAVRLMGEHHRFFTETKEGEATPGVGGPTGGSKPERTEKAEAFTYAKFCESVPDIFNKSSAEQNKAFITLIADERLKHIENPNPRASVAMRLLYQICPRIHDAARQKTLLGSTGSKHSELKALAGIGLSYEDVVQSTGIEPIELGLSIGQLRTDLVAAMAEVKKAQEELKKLKKAQKELQKAMAAGSAPEIQAASARIVSIVGKPPQAPAAAPTGLAGEEQAADAAAPAGDADPCSGPITLACARQTAEAYGLASFDKARETALFEIATLLADPKARAEAAKANCGPPGPAVSDEQMARATRICLTKSAIDLFEVRDRAADIAAGRPGELAELAVLITASQMRVGTAEAKAAALTKRIDNLNAQRAALVNELNILLQAKTHLEQGGDYRVSLLDFGRSIDKGRLAYERANDQFTLIALNDFASREEQVVKGRYALIDGLLATITSSTGAGLKPQELAAFFNAIGVSTLGIAEAAQ
jgi:hypothetical protein